MHCCIRHYKQLQVGSSPPKSLHRQFLYHLDMRTLYPRRACFDFCWFKKILFYTIELEWLVPTMQKRQLETTRDARCYVMKEKITWGLQFGHFCRARVDQYTLEEFNKEKKSTWEANALASFCRLTIKQPNQSHIRVDTTLPQLIVHNESPFIGSMIGCHQATNQCFANCDHFGFISKVSRLGEPALQKQLQIQDYCIEQSTASAEG